MNERIVRIVKPGWENYTGPFGFVNFKDGVSLKPATQHEYDLVAKELPIVDHETGEPLGILVRMMESRHFRLESPRTHEEKMAERVAKESATKAKKASEQTPLTSHKIYSAGELEEIVDKSGIAGLRKIADPLRVKGRSIPELMAAIVRAQDLLPKPPKPAGPVA